LKKLTRKQAQERVDAFHGLGTMTIGEDYVGTMTNCTFIHKVYGICNMRPRAVMSGQSHPHGAVNRRKLTCLGKFGVEHPAQNKAIRQKTEDTCLKKFGGKAPSSNKNIADKIKKTCLAKYGADSPLGSSEIRAKIHTTCIEKYGVDNPLKSIEIKEKVKSTCLNRYGYENVFANQGIKDKIKKTCLERYGVASPMQTPEGVDRQRQACFKLKSFELPRTKEILMLQGYEPYAVTYLLSLGYTEEELLEGFKNRPRIPYASKVYIPDFFIEKTNTIYEVKSQYTLKANYEINLMKRKACEQLGYVFYFVIFEDNGDLKSIF